jgi:hypothetical protein
MEGAGTYLSLFAIEGSGEGIDAVKCTVPEAGSALLRLECQDGPQLKSASIHLSKGLMEADVQVDGIQTHASVGVRPCARLVAEALPVRLAPSPRAPSHVCPADAASKDAKPMDAFLRLIPPATTGMPSIVFEIPRLRIRRRIGAVVSDPERWESQVMPRGWAYVRSSHLFEGGFSAKVVPTRGELVIERGYDGDPIADREEISTPCDSRVVIHDELAARARQAAPSAAPAAPAPGGCGADGLSSVYVVAGDMSPRFTPFDVTLEGGGGFLSLFSIDGSGEGADRVKCDITGADSSQVHFDCQDGPQTKSADVHLSNGRLEADVEVDGVSSKRSVPVAWCALLLPVEMDSFLPESPAAPSHVCRDTDGGEAVDAFLRRGPLDANGMVPILLEVPHLHIRRSVGKVRVNGFDSCWSEITKRGWVYVHGNDGDGQPVIKVVATRSDIVILGVTPSGDRYAREQIPTPCDARIVLHALE